MHYPGNNTVPRANFSAPTFQVVYVFRRAIFALLTAWRINFFAAAKWKLVDAKWHWIYNKQPGRPMPMPYGNARSWWTDYQRGTDGRQRQKQVGALSGHKAPADEGTALWVKTQGRSARRLPKNA